MALLPASSLSQLAVDRSLHVPEWLVHEEAARLRRLRTLLALFDVVHWSLGGLFFGRVVED